MLDIKTLAQFGLRFSDSKFMRYQKYADERAFKIGGYMWIKYELENLVKVEYTNRNIKSWEERFELTPNLSYVEIIENYWLNEASQNSAKTMFWKNYQVYFLLPYIISDENTSIKLEETEETKELHKIQITKLQQLVLLTAFCKLIISKHDIHFHKDKVRVLFSKINYSLGDLKLTQELNTNIFRSVITFDCIDNLTDMLENATHKEYELEIPKEILEDFCLKPTNKIGKPEIQSIFASYVDYAMQYDIPVNNLRKRFYLEEYLCLP